MDYYIYDLDLTQKEREVADEYNIKGINLRDAEHAIYSIIMDLDEQYKHTYDYQSERKIRKDIKNLEKLAESVAEQSPAFIYFS